MPRLSAQSPIMQAVVRGRADCNLQRALPKGVGVYGLLMTTQTAKYWFCAPIHMGIPSSVEGRSEEGHVPQSEFFDCP